MGRHEQRGTPGLAAATDGPAGAPGATQNASGALLHPSYHGAVRAIRDLADAMLASHARAVSGDDADDGSSAVGTVTATGIADGSGSLSSAEPLEIRSIEVRAVGDGGQMVLEGTPIVYNVAYEVYDRHGAFSEVMAPGVCRDVMSQPTTFLYNHDGLVLARAPGTLTLTDTPRALRCRAVLNDTQASRDLYAAVLRGDVHQMSIGMIVADDEWRQDYTQRLVKRLANLIDVSAVATPASPSTHIAVVRSEDELARQRRRRAAALQEIRRIKRWRAA
jgi:Escherichia/Staphylococcus phage prohead protease